jgi:hypothetical protein
VGGFMADARRALHDREQPREADWQLVSRRRQGRRSSNRPPPPPVHRPVPTDLIGRFFNCLRTDVVCPNAACWDQPSALAVGSCWDRPSAFAGIDRRLLLGSTVGSYWDRP